MAKVLVLYYSSYGHIERMALAEADGARGAGGDVDIKRVPELVPRKVALASHHKLDQIERTCRASRPMARPPSLAQTARAYRPRWRSKRRDTRAGM